MEKKGFILVLMLILLVNTINISVAIPEEIENPIKHEINFTAIVNNASANTTNSWNTEIGILETVNNTQFNNNGGTLLIDTSWLSSFGDGEWLELDGSNANQNIDIGNYNFTADNFFGNELISPSNNNTYVELLHSAIQLVANGVSTIYASSGLMEINNAGIDYDLRFRGLNDDNLFYLDASSDRIGIGTSSPTTKLDVNGNVTADNFFGNGSQLTGLPETNLSGYVPYTGATSTVNLGSQNLVTTGTIQAEQITSTDDMTMAGEFLNIPSSSDANPFYIDHYDTNTYTGNDDYTAFNVRTLVTGGNTPNYKGTNVYMNLVNPIDGGGGMVSQNVVANDFTITSSATASNYFLIAKSYKGLRVKATDTSEFNSPSGILTQLTVKGIDLDMSQIRPEQVVAGKSLIYNLQGTYGYFQTGTPTFRADASDNRIDAVGSKIILYPKQYDATFTTHIHKGYTIDFGSSYEMKDGVGFEFVNGKSYSTGDVSAFKVTAMSGTGTNYGYDNQALVDNFMGGDNSKSYFGTGQDMSIGYSGTYGFIDTAEVGSGSLRLGDKTTNYAEIKADGEINLVGTARVYKTTTLRFNHAKVSAHGKPTVVTLGANSGFSLPVYSADNEEIFSCASLPLDLDTTQNMTAYLGTYIDTANNAKKFKLQVSWTIDDLETGDVLSSGTTDVETETTTGNDAQYHSYKPSFNIASVAGGAGAGYKISVRVRRISASSNEIAGEVVVCGMALKYTSNKLGTAL